MANFRNRTRVIYFRVSEDEFQEIQDLCKRHGARNMSELARSALRTIGWQNGDGVAHGVTERLERLENSVEQLSRALGQIVPERQA